MEITKKTVSLSKYCNGDPMDSAKSDSHLKEITRFKVT